MQLIFSFLLVSIVSWGYFLSAIKSRAMRQQVRIRFGQSALMSSKSTSMDNNILDVDISTIKSSPMIEFIDGTASSISSLSLLKLRLFDNKHMNGSTDASKDYLKDLRSVSGRLVNLSAGMHLQLTYSYKTNDITKNFLLSDAAIECNKLIMSNAFRMGQLDMKNKSIELNLKRGKGKLKTYYHESPSEILIKGNDVPKKHLIDISSPFLNLLGITVEGKIKTNSAAKFNQIQKFIEILNGLVRSTDLNTSTSLSIIDMGCGMGYLTFACHQHFSSIHQNQIMNHKKVTTIGIENRYSLVDKTNKIAQELNMTGLEFIQGNIDTYQIKACDILIALHACDTATDDVIKKGIVAKVPIIVLAPCCHKELRKFIDLNSKQLVKNEENFEGLNSLLKHGIYRERFTEMTTDTIRAIVLEMNGYDTKIFEFIGGEHTAKNVMLVAVRSAKGRTEEEIVALKRRLLGVLRDLLGGVEGRSASLHLMRQMGIAVELER